MININIPGNKEINIENVVFDFNGTLADDGILSEEVKGKILELHKRKVKIYVITADTYGSVKKQCEGLPVKVMVFDKDNVAMDKKNIVDKLGKKKTVTFGNGNNDIEMFKTSSLSIAIIGSEGASSKAMLHSDIVVKNITDGIDLLIKKDRVRATLRA